MLLVGVTEIKFPSHEGRPDPKLKAFNQYRVYKREEKLRDPGVQVHSLLNMAVVPSGISIE